MRLTKHITEDFALENNAKHLGAPQHFVGALDACTSGVEKYEKRRTPVRSMTLRALINVFKFHCR